VRSLAIWARRLASFEGTPSFSDIVHYPENLTISSVK
jgi:hypothetical protein